jgi:hypothetical protein
MLQPLLTVIEVALVLAALYVYWMTRKLLMEAREQSKTATGDIEIVRDVAELLTELQSATNAARAEWVRQNAVQQESLRKAEEAIAELRSLMDQTQQIDVRPGPSAPVPSTKQPGVETILPNQTLAQAAEAFHNQLLNVQHRDAASAKLELGHIQGFMNWLGGRQWQQADLSIVGPQDIESYAEYLESLEYGPATVASKRAALRSFLVWAGILEEESQTTSNAGDTNPLDQASLSSDGQSPVEGQNIRQAIVSLAGQGMDSDQISVRLGLEREAVWTILSAELPNEYLEGNEV